MQNKVDKSCSENSKVIQPLDKSESMQELGQKSHTYIISYILLSHFAFRYITDSQWLFCMIWSDEQISPPRLFWKQNSSHLHAFCVCKESFELYCPGNSFTKNVANLKFQDDAWW